MDQLTASAIEQVTKGEKLEPNAQKLVDENKAEIAKDINVNVSDIPVNVQVPVSVAAAICNVQVAALAQQKNKGDTACAPTAGSSALNSAILKSIKKQK